MLNYLIFVFIIIALLSFFDISELTKRQKIPILVFVFLLMWFAAAFRFGDKDYYSYIRTFNIAPNWPSYELMEPGYRYLGYFMKLIGVNAESFLALFALFSVGLMTKFIYKFNRFFVVAMLAYFSHVFILRDMLQIRSSLAIGILMFSIPSIYNRDFKKFLIFFFLGSIFHFLSFFWIIIYFAFPVFFDVKLKKIKIRKAIWFLIIGFVLGLILNLSFFNFVLQITHVNILYLYLNDPRYNTVLGLTNPVLIKNYLLLIIVFIYRDRLEKNIPYFSVLLISYVLSAFWLSAFNVFAIFAGRVATLFSNAELVLLPSLMYIPKNKKIRIFILVLIVLYCFVVFYTKWGEILEFVRFVF